MAANRKWHMENRMPKNATFGQRVAWHIEHAKNCPCAPIPEALQEEMERKHIKVPRK
jgi:hypothetical protein